MKNAFYVLYATILLAVLAACSSNEPGYDATGSFEADEIIIAAEVPGIVQQMHTLEGSQVEAGEVVGWIDTTQLHLKKLQLLAQMAAVEARKPEASVQLAALYAQWQNAKQELERSKQLLAGKATSAKQVDDLTAQTEQLEKQYTAQLQQLQKSNKALAHDLEALHWQLKQLEEQLRQSVLVSPIKAVVIKQFVQRYEMVQPGKPLFKLADLRTLYLRVYLTADQLADIKLGQRVKVHSDNGEGGMLENEGKLVWVSEKAEFTPKSIQTKNERANQVYAAKIAVANDGRLKIGMYGQMAF